jgi:hypothetical protein
MLNLGTVSKTWGTDRGRTCVAAADTPSNSNAVVCRDLQVLEAVRDPWRSTKLETSWRSATVCISAVPLKGSLDPCQVFATRVNAVVPVDEVKEVIEYSGTNIARHRRPAVPHLGRPVRQNASESATFASPPKFTSSYLKTVRQEAASGSSWNVNLSSIHRPFT